MQAFKNKDFTYFGEEFELKVMNLVIGDKQEKGKTKTQIRRDHQYGSRVLPHLKPHHFSNDLAKKIVVSLQNYLNKTNKIPFYDTIKAMVKGKIADEFQIEQIFQYLKDIQTVQVDDSEFVKEQTVNFINTRNLQDLLQKVETRYINKGKYDKFPEIIDMVNNAFIDLQDTTRLEAFVAGDHRDLKEGQRHTIPTGLDSLDRDMNGGLALSELGLGIAGLKVGKTTLASTIANNAALEGYNVLQIYFEDTDEQVKMKHRAKMAGVSLSSFNNKNSRKSIAKRNDTQLKKIRAKEGCLVLKKMDSTNTTVKDIEKIYRMAKDRGVYFADTQSYEKITFDLVLIDYIDCIKPKGNYRDDWGGDKEILRDLENLCSKDRYNFACWAFTQGGRSSLNNELVTVEDMGGSIKKAQIAHFIFSISKTLHQRSEGKGTFAILGSRVGRDGIIYKDCTFDNALMQIELAQEEKLSEVIKNDGFSI